MSTNLPAAQLLAKADDMKRAALMYADDAISTEDFVAIVYDYSAARAASPVTLEEALMIREHNAKANLRRGAECESSDDAERRDVEWIDAREDRQRHARRLAGEGGA